MILIFLLALIPAAIAGLFVFLVWRWLRMSNPTPRIRNQFAVFMFALALVFLVVGLLVSPDRGQPETIVLSVIIGGGLLLSAALAIRRLRR